MKILAFVDMHGNEAALNRIKEKAAHSDVVVCAGDVSIFSNDLDVLLLELNKLKKPVLIIPGNHEDDEELQMLAKGFKNIKYIHAGSYIVDDYIFFGYGGGGFSTIDDDFDKVSRKFEREIKEFGRKPILVTHAPPYKTKIDLIGREHCGNKNITKFIHKIKPVLVISGHLHENAGKEDFIGATKVINPGPSGAILYL